MDHHKIKELVSQLTLDEKAGLCSGQDNWFTKAIDRLGIPAIHTSDGPHGLRTQKGEINSLAEEASAPAVCFPAACATASSFDRNLLHKLGAELGMISQSLGVGVLLGPGINIKRSPLCGRNFEYFSEDPLVAGELGAAFTLGVQSEGVGVSLKHFFANNQEHRRMDSSSEMDERTMREIYLCAFETVIKNANPWTIMASYNKIDGVYSTANKRYLTDILRNEWGFDGLVMSDWGATHDRVGAVEAGCALTMPSASETDREIVKAVQEGSLDISVLDNACEQLLTLVFKVADTHRDGESLDFERGHRLAKEIAEQSAVLLKNESGILPLSTDKTVAFIGGFAKTPRYQGGGSSHINSSKVVSAIEATEEAGYAVSYAQGYPDSGTVPDEALIAEAAAMAKTVDVAVVFAGLPEAMESEGIDRRHLNMPESHNKLIEAVCAANSNSVVVLHNGAPVEMPWLGLSKAVLEMYLGGQAVGEATVSLLYGKANPSGHLAETFPLKLSDTSTYLFYFGERDRVRYSERFFVGYRYTVSKNLLPMFSFGYGLSYTTFSYSDLTIDKSIIDDTDTLTVSVCVTNTGSMTGKALVQLYVASPRENVIAPVRELRAFETLVLTPGESQPVIIELSKRAFAIWSEDFTDWRVEGGSYTVQICENAHSVLLEQHVTVNATKPLYRVTYSLDVTMGDFAKMSVGHKFLDDNIGFLVNGMAAAGFMPQEAAEAMSAMGNGKINLAALEAVADRMGVGAGGTGGIGALFVQQLSMMANFLPQDRRDELNDLLRSLNEGRNEDIRSE